MALHFHSQSWQVPDRADRRCVPVADVNRAAVTLPALLDEPFDLASAGCRRVLSLDLGGLTMPTPPQAAKLIEPRERLHAAGRRLILLNAGQPRANRFGPSY